MTISLKRVLFFLFAVSVLGASPAFSVPLSSGIDAQGTAVSGAGTTDPDGETALEADGSAERVPEARIVDHQVAMSSVSERSEESGPHPEIGMGGQASMGASGGGNSMPGWVLPVAGVAAGGGALFALTSHGHKDAGASGTGLDQAAELGTSGSGGGTISAGGGHGHGPGDENPSAVPEPGTLLMMGAGIASFLSRRKILGS